MEYKIIYTEAEDMAMKSISYSVDEWVQNVCHERASKAIDAIVDRSLSKFFQAGIQIPSSKAEIVLAAFANGWERTAAETHDEFIASLSANTQS
jgi:hypothetical protein